MTSSMGCQLSTIIVLPLLAISIAAFPQQSTGSDTPVAHIGEQVITLSEVDREGEDVIWDARVELYELRKENLTDIVNSKLIKLEA